VSGALVDSSVLLDYLKGEKRAKTAMSSYSHRAISVVTWLEVMEQCPAEVLEETRSFLRTFERLSISEAIADEALQLLHDHEGLKLPQALTWAAATVNKIVWLCVNPPAAARHHKGVVAAYGNRDRK
jgi:predicted nucleic acid-binding protein